MEPERWDLIKNVLADACTLSGEARKALIDQRCGSDTALRAEVETVLAAHDRQPNSWKYRLRDSPRIGSPKPQPCSAHTGSSATSAAAAWRRF